jgi:hypothetical protein
VDKDEEGPYVLHSKLKNIYQTVKRLEGYIMMMYLDILKLLGEDGLKIMTQLENGMA